MRVFSGDFRQCTVNEVTTCVSDFQGEYCYRDMYFWMIMMMILSHIIVVIVVVVIIIITIIINPPPRTMKLLVGGGGDIGFTPFVRPSVRPSVRLSVCPSVRPSCIPCPLCSPYSSGWIHFIFIHRIKQPQKVCRVLNLLWNPKIWIFDNFFNF